jgi:hypothetical protein
MLPPQFHNMTSLVQWRNRFVSEGFLGLSTNGNKYLNPHSFMLGCVILISFLIFWCLLLLCCNSLNNRFLTILIFITKVKTAVDEWKLFVISDEHFQHVTFTRLYWASPSLSV